MKIGQIDNKLSVSTAATERKSASAPAAGSEAEPSAKVALSQAGNLVGGAGAEGSFDSEKVDRIAAAIRDGKFKINAEAIADKLLQNAHELMGRPAAR